MHILKGGASDYGSLKKEAFRESNFNSKVGTINSNLTSLNYGLVEDAPKNIDKFIKSLGVDRKIRNDAVRFVSIIVDYPKDETKVSKEFFEDVKREIQNYFGVKDKAILYAQVHLDEGHPHMHFTFVPTVEKEKTYKDGHTETKVNLSAKDILTRKRLQQFHPHIQKRMYELGYTGTIHHNDGIKRDKEFIEHKLDIIEKEIKIATKELEHTKDNANFWKKQEETYMHKALEMQDKVSELTDKKNKLMEEVNRIKKIIQRITQILLDKAHREACNIILDAIKQAKDIRKQLKEDLDAIDKQNKKNIEECTKLEKQVDKMLYLYDAVKPLRDEYERLKEEVNILEGKYRYEYTKKYFVESKTPLLSKMYRDRGELIALYQDGSTRQVGSNENNEFDNKTLKDKAEGRCIIGIMQEEEHITIPKSLINELLQNRDLSKKISESLKNFLEQQKKVDEGKKQRGLER